VRNASLEVKSEVFLDQMLGRELRDFGIAVFCPLWEEEGCPILQRTPRLPEELSSQTPSSPF
jgi:hypothetical protein